MYLSRIQNAYDSNEITRAYFERIFVESRYLDSVTPDLSMQLYGETFSSPVMIAAFSHLSNTHPGGMVEMAKGAYESGICNWAGMGSKDELGNILATGAKTIKIIKPYADRRRVFDMIEYACKSGAIAVGMDIDHSFGGCGYPDVVLGDEMKPVSGDELREFISASDRPFIIKGVLSAADAEKCASAGAKALLVSHHHGIMQYAVPPLMALPEIRKAVGNDIDLFVDCSVDTGADVFKCLAMGAKAVCVGRAILASFKEHGAAGVKQYVEQMNNGLRAMMARTCSKDLNHIAQNVLWDGATGKRL